MDAGAMHSVRLHGTFTSADDGGDVTHAGGTISMAGAGGE